MNPTDDEHRRALVGAFVEIDRALRRLIDAGVTWAWSDAEAVDQVSEQQDGRLSVDVLLGGLFGDDDLASWAELHESLDALAHSGRCVHLQESFGLDGDSLRYLLVLASADLDPTLGDLYGAAQLSGGRRPGRGLVLRLAGLHPCSARARRVTAPGRSLLREGLIGAGPPEADGEDHDVVHPTVLDFLLGQPVRVEAVERVRLPHLPLRDRDDRADDGAIGLDLSRGLPVLALDEPDGMGLARLHAAFERASVRSLSVDLDAVAPDERGALAVSAYLQARFDAAVLLVVSDDDALDPVLSGRGAPVVLLRRTEPPAAWLGRFAQVVDLPHATLTERAALWHLLLPHLDDAPVAQLARTARVDAASMLSIARQAGARTEGDAATTVATVDELARIYRRPRLQTLFQKKPVVTVDDVVLGDEQRRRFDQLLTRVRHREELRTLRVGGAGSARSGTCALFAGPSGTGKTVLAEALAAELRTDLYVVQFNELVSKYVGETEKNLERIFDEADRTGGVVLFDEADAIFGKRVKAETANDRFANLQVSYLLQRLERFEGTLVLTSNFGGAVDEALMRRLDVVITFPALDVALRVALWRRMLGDITLADDVDLTELARLEFNGGEIRNIAVAAAFCALGEHRPIAWADIVRASRDEQVKLRRIPREAHLSSA